ncbi:MAG: DUF7309 domain-containing protein, partial [Planctomycetota bacterium]
PNEDYPVVGAIMGQSGQEFGISLTRGENAFAHLWAMWDFNPSEEKINKINMMSVSYEEFSDLQPGQLDVVEKAGRNPDPTNKVPVFLVKEPGKMARDANPREARSLLQVTRGVLRAYSRALLQPNTIQEPGNVLTLVVDESGGDETRVLTEWRSFEGQEFGRIEPLLTPPEDLWDLSQRDCTLLVGLRMLPVALEEGDMMGLLVAADEDSEMVLGCEAVPGGNPQKTASLLFDFMRGETDIPGVESGVPTRLTMTNRDLFSYMKPALESLGTECDFRSSHPLLEEIYEVIMPDLGLEEEMLDPKVPGDVGEFEFGGADDSGVATGELRAWKQVDGNLCARMGEMVLDGGPGAWALGRYFGDKKTGERMMDRGNELIFVSFLDWCAMDYRPKANSDTYAEKLSGQDLPPREAQLLENRMEALASLWLIEEVFREEGKIEMRDVLLGGRKTVYDATLTQSAEVGDCLCARVYEAGDYNFIGIVGPIIMPIETGAVLQFLDEEGMEFTETGVQKHPELFGHLWDFLDDHEPPTETNVDGTDVRLLALACETSDPDIVREQLDERDDVERTEDFYVWSGGPGYEGCDALAHMWFDEGGELFCMQVNSIERLHMAQDMVTGIEGLTVSDVVEISQEDLINEMKASEDTDTAVEELSAEERDFVEKDVRQYYMDWLDTPCPSLKGQTPREVCETESGKKRVAAMIRSFAPSEGPDGMRLEAPKEKMFEELGLDD